MALVYADASVLVKLVRTETHTPALRRFLAGADVVSSALVLAEVPRAVRRAAADDPSVPLALMLQRSEEVLDGLALHPVDDELLAAAGSLAEPRLRALDAVHVAAAMAVAPLDAFVSYDVRQGAVARLAGLRTMAPGAV